MRILEEKILPGNLVLEETNKDRLLCRVVYPICNIGKRNANNRIYEKAVWEKVLGDSDIQEKLKNRALFGQAEHPTETQSDLQLTSHVIFEMWIDEEKGQVFQKMDVLDTPTGRVIDTLLRAGCQVGVSTRAEGDLEEAEDNEGKFSRVIPESYKYITTDFTADPSTFGAIPIDVRQNVESRIKAELKNEDLKEGERTFAKMLLESIQKAPEKKEMTLEQAVKDGIVKEGTKFVFGDGDYKDKKGEVKKIDETSVSVAVHDEDAVNIPGNVDVSITGNSVVTINPDKSVLIIPYISEEPGPGNTGVGMPAVEPEEPEQEEEAPEEPEPEEPEQEEEAPEELEPEEEEKSEEEVPEREVKDETKEDIVETIKKEEDGWHVYSKKGKHLGGPYSSKKKAEKRLAQVEMFKHMEENVDKGIQVGDTVQILDEEGNTVVVPHAEVHQVDEALGNDGEMYTTVEVTGSEDEDEQQWYSEEQYNIVVLKSASESKEVDEKHVEDLSKLSDDELLDHLDYWEGAGETGDPHNVDQAKKELERIRAEVSRRGFKRIATEGVNEKWKDLPKGWTRKSVDSFARSLTKKTKGDPRGFVRACVAKMKGKVSNPKAFCASLKDEYLGTTKWRGKESVEVNEKKIKVGDTVQFTEFSYPNVAGGTSTANTAPVTDLDIYFDDVATGTVTKVMYRNIHVKLDDKTWDLIKDKAKENVAYVDINDLAESKPVSDVAREITDLKVKEASTRAERDKAIELLEKLEAEEKQLKGACSTRALEVKILSKKIKDLATVDEKVIAALRHKLEEKVAKVKKLNQRITRMKESHEKEINNLKESIVSLKRRISEKIRRAEEKAKEDITKEFIKQFVDFRLAESGLTVDSNSRALLENCETLDQVDDVFEEIRDIRRRSALHSDSLEKVTIKPTKSVDPEQVDVNEKVGMVFEGLGFKKR